MTIQKIQGACKMINYPELRQKLQKFDVSLKGFQETVDLAVEQHAKLFMPKMPMFASQDEISQAYADAEGDVLDMPYDEIYKLACDACVCNELAMDKKQEDDADPFVKAYRTGAEQGK